MKLTEKSLREIIANQIEKVLNEEAMDIEVRDDAYAGGENLESPIDHAKIVSDESNVMGIESLDPQTGEVTVVEENIIRNILEKVNLEITRRVSLR